MWPFNLKNICVPLFWYMRHGSDYDMLLLKITVYLSLHSSLIYFCLLFLYGSLETIFDDRKKKKDKENNIIELEWKTNIDDMRNFVYLQRIIIRGLLICAIGEPLYFVKLVGYMCGLWCIWFNLLVVCTIDHCILFNIYVL